MGGFVDVKSLLEELKELKNRIAQFKEVLNLEKFEEELSDIEREMKLSSFWQDKKKANQVIERANFIKNFLVMWQGLWEE